jgi:hypothetical protein
MKNKIIFVLAVIAIFVMSITTVEAWCWFGLMGNTCGVKGGESQKAVCGDNICQPGEKIKMTSIIKRFTGARDIYCPADCAPIKPIVEQPIQPITAEEPIPGATTPSTVEQPITAEEPIPGATTPSTGEQPIPIVCGDGICSVGENSICPNDCVSKQSTNIVSTPESIPVPEPGVHTTSAGSVEPRVGLEDLNVRNIDAVGDVGIRGKTVVEGNVGIGTQNPQAKLDIEGDVNINGQTVVEGDVGIGTQNPQAKLDVRGDIMLPFAGALKVSSWEGDNRPWTNIKIMETGYERESASEFVNIYTSGLREQNVNPQITIRTSDTYGRVGIGTPYPQAKLDVRGDIMTKNIKFDDPGDGAKPLDFTNEYGIWLFTAGRATSTLWLDAPEKGEVIIGPRANAGLLDNLRLRSRTISLENRYSGGSALKIENGDVIIKLGGPDINRDEQGGQGGNGEVPEEEQA